MSRIFQHFSLFVGLSLLLHLGIGLYFSTTTKPKTPPQPAPFFVDLREPLASKVLEQDLLDQPTISSRTTPATRLGPNDLSVPREMAPRGNAEHDTAPITSPQAVIPSLSQPELIASRPSPIVRESTIVSREKPPLLSNEDLFRSTNNAAQNVAELDPEINQKMRKDVAEGQAVWLDTEKDILFSFSKRMVMAISDVWIYPQAAIVNGESGSCLYKVTINRAGILVGEPVLLKSSGSSVLDEESARSIHEATPRFGFLPDAYPYETYTFFLEFTYTIIGNRRTIYGERYR